MNTPHATAADRRFTVPTPLAGLLNRLPPYPARCCWSPA